MLRSLQFFVVKKEIPVHMDFKKHFRSESSPTNPHLEKAAHAVALADNENTRRALYESLLKSTLIISGSVAADEENSPRNNVAGENTRIYFRTVERPPGNIVLPVFTDVAALKDWHQQEVPWIAMAAPALFAALVKTGIHEISLNPVRPDQQIKRPGGIVTRAEFRALAQGMIPGQRLSANMTETIIRNELLVVAGLPMSPPPPALLTELAALFEKTADLQAAYLFQLGHGNDTRTVVGLHFVAEPEETRMRQLMIAIGGLLRIHLGQDQYLDFVSLQDPQFRETVERSGKPIFKRETVC